MPENRTEEIIIRFKTSWIEVEKLYDMMIENGGFKSLLPLRQLVSDLKEQGEDQYFRAGTTMYSLILSRSVDYGLRQDQKYIRIELYDNNVFEVILRDGKKVYREYKITSSQDIRLTKMLRTLKDTIVD